MKLFHASVLMLLGLATTGVQAWENHTLASYRAFERMPEVANAPPATVEPLEAFLRAEENTIEALLASQEAWARANLGKYPARPNHLAFTAIPNRSDEARRIAFLQALRIAPNSKFALFIQPDPWNPAPGTPLPASAVNTLWDSQMSSIKFLAIKAGDQIPALTVLASASDEPDYGLDMHLWDDSPSEWGRQYGFGPQPFGNPALAYSSMAPFHMAFMHESPLINMTAPFLHRTFPLLRSHQFSTLSALAFRTGHAYWGWRFAGLSLHYLQDLTQPYHASVAPGESTIKLLGINALAMVGGSGKKNDLLVLLSNRHLVLERYQAEYLLQSAARCQESAMEQALRNGDKDRTYPEWSERYLREVVSLQAAHSANGVTQRLLAAMPALYVSDPTFDFGVRQASIQLHKEMGLRESAERRRLNASMASLMENFGAHSRNALRGILRASNLP
ncbi:MAG: hypothetical protein ORN28_12170 [Rhodoferax sp.]|nr:hypothetical protein [Rhodoferax sp.]